MKKLLIIILTAMVLAPVTAAAKITVFTDSSGKVHISNQAIETSRLKPVPPPRGVAPGTGSEAERLPAPPPPLDDDSNQEPPSPPPLLPDRRNIAQENHPSQIRPAAASGLAPIVRRSQPTQAGRVTSDTSGTGSIRVSLNEQGVLCITNLPEKEPWVPAAPDKPQQPRAQIPDTPVAWGDNPLQGLLRPAAQKQKPAVSQAVILQEGPIRRTRDKKGVIRISNLEAIPWRQRGSEAAVLPPPPKAGAALPLTMHQPMSENPGGPLRTVAVRRDAKGRLQIYSKTASPLLAEAVRPNLDRLDPALVPIVKEAASIYQLPPSLILSVIRLESNFAPWAVSPKGAMGLMQLMPGTAADLGVQDPFCPRQNIMGGSRYLRHLLNSFNGSLHLAVAAYNAGPHRVVAAGHQIPEIKETKQFVSRVLGLYTLLEKVTPVPQP